VSERTTNGADTDPGTGTEPETETDTGAEAHRRRTIIRLLVGLGIGIPVLIELATFVGLVEQSLLGGDGGDDSESTGDGSGTAGGDAGGDELVPATPQTETLSVASFRAGADSWVLTLAAAVENTGPEPYVVQFGPVTTEGGRRVEGSTQAVSVPPDGTGQVTGTWQLPPGSRPATVVVRTATGDDETVAHEVELARIAVEGN
jgi:hypothetical protein